MYACGGQYVLCVNDDDGLRLPVVALLALVPTAKKTDCPAEWIGGTQSPSSTQQQQNPSPIRKHLYYDKAQLQLRYYFVVSRLCCRIGSVRSIRINRNSRKNHSAIYRPTVLTCDGQVLHFARETGYWLVLVGHICILQYAMGIYIKDLE